MASTKMSRIAFQYVPLCDLRASEVLDGFNRKVEVTLMESSRGSAYHTGFKGSVMSGPGQIRDLTSATIWSTPHATSTTWPGTVTWNMERHALKIVLLYEDIKIQQDPTLTRHGKNWSSALPIPRQPLTFLPQTKSSPLSETKHIPLRAHSSLICTCTVVCSLWAQLHSRQTSSCQTAVSYCLKQRSCLYR